MKNFITKYAIVIVAVITTLAIGIALVVSLGMKDNSVKQIKPETTVELGQKFTFVATDFFDVSAEEAEKFLDMGIDTLMTNNFCVISMNKCILDYY